MVENELITDVWKQRMRDVLQKVYGGKLKEEGLNRLLDLEVEKSLSKGKRVTYLRDMYRYQILTLDLNEILMWVYKHNLIIGANGSFTHSPEDVLGDTSVMVIGDLKSRAFEKNLAKDFEKNNMLKEATLHDNLQMKYKMDVNSTYGIACMPGSFLFSPDSASFITTQARELISEMLWSFERFLANNLQLTSYNEALLYIDSCLKEERHWDKYKQYIDYIPTKKDITKHLLSKFADMPNFTRKTKEISRSLFIFMENLTEEERVYLYYKMNFIELIKKNSYVINIFRDILNKEEEFLNPERIPEVYAELCNKLIDITKEFCYTSIMTTHRVDKYFNSERKSVLLSDTDSVFIIFGGIMEAIYKEVGYIYKYKNNDFKLVNSLCTLCTHYIEMRHDKFVEACNVKYKFPEYKLEAKNEFYYKRVIIYTGIKKNYSGLKLLREGNKVPPKKQISHTGIKLTGSGTPKQVSDFQTRLLEEYILRADVVDPVLIMNEIKKEGEIIKGMIMSGDKFMGIPQRFSGYDKYKVFESMQICRLVEIWNRLYPDQRIGSGEYLMTFETRIKSESDLVLISDVKMREKIITEIYRDRPSDKEKNFLTVKGLSTIGIPKDGQIQTLPQWMIEIIDYDIMSRKHLKAIIDLLPSLNMSKVKTKDFTTYSSLLKI
ncbi:MAG: family B DNA polymerase [Anaeroplasmataceae bacterium]